MPSQGVFSNQAPDDGSIRVLYQTINGQQHIRAITVSNVDVDGDNISISLNELDSISFPISSSGVPSKLNALSITEKQGYYFIDVDDIVLNDVNTSTSSTTGISPYLTETFFYNNYNAIISNAEDAESSTLRFDVDRVGSQVKPSNFNALAGFGTINYSDMLFLSASGDALPYFSTDNATSGDTIGVLTSSIHEFLNDRDVNIRVLKPELEAVAGIPQTSLVSMNNDLFTSSFQANIDSFLNVEIDDNPNFDDSNNHFYSASILTQTYINGDLDNYTYNPFKHFIASGSFTSGDVYIKLKQRTVVNSITNIQEIQILPALTATPSTKDFLTVDQFFLDQQPYATPAPVQDSNYTSTGFINARYNGSKTGEEDFSGISPAVAAKPLDVAVYREDESNGFICSQSLDERTIETVLYEGASEFPQSSLITLGYINQPYSGIGSDTNNTFTIQGIRGIVPQAGDIIEVSTETMKILTVTSVPSTSKFPYYDIYVERDISGTKVSSLNAGQKISVLAGARMLKIDKSRLIALSNKKIWIKENRNVVKTNDRGFVIEISEVCTV